jgi:hypothetical protein
MAIKFAKDIKSPTTDTVVAVPSAGKHGQLITESVVTEPSKKVHTPTLEVQAQTETEVLTDEYITLATKFEEFEGSKMVKRMETVKKALQSIANDTCPPDAEATLSGSLGQVIFSKRVVGTDFPEQEKQVLISTLFEKFGLPVLAQTVKISVADLKKVLSEMEIDKYAEHPFGARILKLVKPF